MLWSTTCVWKFITEADLRIVLGVTDITKDATDTITLRDSNGDILPTTSVAVGTREGFEIVTSTGNSISIQLDTNDSSNDEEIFIYVISGVDSGTCPGTSTISATDEYQIVTSSNFPDNYNGNEVCTVSITADENKVISYEILFKQIEDSTTFDECSEIFEVFDGSTLENRIFDTCNPFLPGRLSKLKTTSVGRTLDLRFVSDFSDEKRGFVLLFKQEGLTLFNYPIRFKILYSHSYGYKKTEDNQIHHFVVGKTVRNSLSEIFLYLTQTSDNRENIAQ
uniref:CUB domain-containing protein n=1 Tax=Magallana gigas TaxID=29159 RepID=A0A8W8JMD4_MAGGI